MNAKKAKLLRRLVRNAAVDEKGVPIQEGGYVENTGHRKYVTVEKVSGDGKSTYTDKEQIAAGTISVEKRSVKGLYKTMKKKYQKALNG